jgi:NitT/TauT family transport system ATP-binding protein
LASALKPPRAGTTDGSLSLRGVSKVYDPLGLAVVAVENWTLEIAAGEFVAVVGPSGCGKTTLLNAIAGFDPISGGEIVLDGKTVASPAQSARPGAQRVVVFQNGSLFPWKTVVQNVAYGPIVQRRMSRAQALGEARSFLARVGLADVADAYPGKLSSGVQRRVEMVRALINDLLKEAVFLGDRLLVMTPRPARVTRVIDIDLPRPLSSMKKRSSRSTRKAQRPSPLAPSPNLYSGGARVLEVAISSKSVQRAAISSETGTRIPRLEKIIRRSKHVSQARSHHANRATGRARWAVWIGVAIVVADVLLFESVTRRTLQCSRSLTPGERAMLAVHRCA